MPNKNMKFFLLQLYNIICMHKIFLGSVKINVNASSTTFKKFISSYYWPLPAQWLVGRVFANGPGDLGSILGHVIPKTLKWYLIPPYITLSNIRYVSRVNWSNPGKGAAPSPTTWCSSYWKGSFQVALDYGHQLNYLLIIGQVGKVFGRGDWSSIPV